MKWDVSTATRADVLAVEWGIRWPCPGNSRDRPWGELLAAYGEFLMAAVTIDRGLGEKRIGELGEELTRIAV